MAGTRHFPRMNYNLSRGLTDPDHIHATDYCALSGQTIMLAFLKRRYGVPSRHLGARVIGYYFTP
jgi:hypothetical protein